MKEKPNKQLENKHPHTEKTVFLSPLILTNFQTTQQEIPKLDGTSENQKKKIYENVKTTGYEFYESYTEYKTKERQKNNLME